MTPANHEVEDLKAQVAALTNDWPNLARYRADNTRLGAPAPGEVRVVFLGDSITDSWPNTGTFFSRRHYIGRGISGQTTPQMLVRFQQDVAALGPKVVVILAGTNDVAGNTGPYNPELTRNCLASMVELAQARGIRVVLASVLPAFDYPWRTGLQPAAKIAALNAWIKDYAARNHCVYLDYFAAMADSRPGLKAEYSEDGVHPNAAGYAVMEPLAEQAIAQALAP
ncbi:MAG: SGNH/GDSL hydrolase family protein [Opitutales bacterium]